MNRAKLDLDNAWCEYQGSKHLPAGTYQLSQEFSPGPSGADQQQQQQPAQDRESEAVKNLKWSCSTLAEPSKQLTVTEKQGAFLVELTGEGDVVCVADYREASTAQPLNVGECQAAADIGCLCNEEHLVHGDDS